MSQLTGKFKYPMVWMTPTGKKALQVHGIAVRKMYLKATPTSEVQVVEDVVKIRELLHSWQERIIRPEYVLMGPVEEGDLQMWDNWVSSHCLQIFQPPYLQDLQSVFHTAVDYPDHYGPRSK